MNNNVRCNLLRLRQILAVVICRKGRFVAGCVLLWALSAGAEAQTGKPEVSGYVGGMPSVIVQQPAGDVWWQAQVHNRINAGWQFSEFWRVDAGVRNRFMSGSEAMLQPESTGFDAGWADLSWNVFNAKARGAVSLLNMAIDRLSVTFERDGWQLKLGRQRINWGQTLVWNPNNIFNTYSFFDFDYPERPGCDALRATYYHSETASSELAASVNRDGRLTAAALHHWNLNRFDFQLMAGEQAESDIVLGGAWTGDFNGLNFRGECSFFRPVKHFGDTTTIVAASVGLDYLFGNSLMLQVEALYNNAGSVLSGDGPAGLYAAPLSAKTLSICDWNLFGQASMPVTPRLDVSLSGMYFADIEACYAGLSADYSILENLDFSFVAQYFSTTGSAGAENMRFLLGFARVKYSF